MNAQHHHRSERYELKEIFSREEMSEFSTWNPVKKCWYTTDKRMKTLFSLVTEKLEKKEDKKEEVKVKPVVISQRIIDELSAPDVTGFISGISKNFDKMMAEKLLSAHTQILYKTTFKDFIEWVKEKGIYKFDEEVVQRYVKDKRFKESVKSLKMVVFNQLMKHLNSPDDQNFRTPKVQPMAPKKNETVNRRILIRPTSMPNTPGNNRDCR